MSERIGDRAPEDRGGEMREASGPGGRGGGERWRPGDGRDDPRGGPGWGGRVGARLDELDRATRTAIREAAQAARSRELLLRWGPLAAVAAAGLAAGLALALLRRRR